MRILITGNTGYIGPVLVRHFRKVLPAATLIGYDSGFFAHCLTGADYVPEFDLDCQHWGDVRQVPDSLLEGIDAIVHLAAVSNDPMGNRFESVTHAINFEAGATLARRAKTLGVKHFVFASSCSMYGYAEGGPRTENDSLNPLTAYARSKVATEATLAELADARFVVTSLRFSTACGMSERLRLDLVLNDFVACAVSNGLITVLSDGSPWRPLIDVADMARAIEWAVWRLFDNGGAFVAVNVGSNDRNFQVKQLAQAVARAVPNASYTINADAPPDKRSYKVNFDNFAKLAPQHQPRVTLEQSIHELIDGLGRINFCQKEFRNSDFMRLKVLEGHIARGRLSEELYWVGKKHIKSS